ncbi:uncharacterized protein [Antedon mediterranea]|uniref:uncharacterized protein n=1 Tax=Antedon mediterranea TaxID=105859 RepID=UPI003AF54253
MTDLRRQTILNQSGHSPFQSVPYSPVIMPTRRWSSPAATVPDWSSEDKNQNSFDRNVPQTPISVTSASDFPPTTPKIASTPPGTDCQLRTPMVASTPPDQLVPSTPIEYRLSSKVQPYSTSRPNRSIEPSPVADTGIRQSNLFDGDDDDIFPT